MTNSFKEPEGNSQEARDAILEKLRPAKDRLCAQWKEGLNILHISPAESDALTYGIVALSAVACWAVSSVLLRTHRFGPAVERFLPAHSAYLPRSYTLLTSALRFAFSSLIPIASDRVRDRPSTGFRLTFWKVTVTFPVIQFAIPLAGASQTIVPHFLMLNFGTSCFCWSGLSIAEPRLSL